MYLTLWYIVFVFHHIDFLGVKILLVCGVGLELHVDVVVRLSVHVHFNMGPSPRDS